MDFVKYISTAHSTYTEAAPLITKLKLTRGRLTGGQIYFPSGPAGTLHFLAKIGIHQILPFNTGENFRLDDAVMSFTLGINLSEQPFVIDLVTWNDSSQYAHVCTVSFSLMPSLEGDYDLKSLLATLSASK